MYQTRIDVRRNGDKIIISLKGTQTFYYSADDAKQLAKLLGEMVRLDVSPIKLFYKLMDELGDVDLTA